MWSGQNREDDLQNEVMNRSQNTFVLW